MGGCSQCIRCYQCEAESTHWTCKRDHTDSYNKLDKVDGVVHTATERFTTRTLLPSQTWVWVPETVVRRARECLTDTAGTGIRITGPQVYVDVTSKAMVVPHVQFTVGRCITQSRVVWVCHKVVCTELLAWVSSDRLPVSSYYCTSKTQNKASNGSHSVVNSTPLQDVAAEAWERILMCMLDVNRASLDLQLATPLVAERKQSNQLWSRGFKLYTNAVVYPCSAVHVVHVCGKL